MSSSCQRIGIDLFVFSHFTFGVNITMLIRSVNGQTVGRVDVTDGDKGDRVSLLVRGEMAGVFGITNDGDILVKNIGYMRGQVAHLLFVAQVGIGR